MLKARELEGRRFRLVRMGEDPDPVPAGATGTIDSVAPWAPHEYHLNVTWDAEVGRSLNLILPVDEIELLEEPT
jgi:hypothetical protein